MINDRIRSRLKYAVGTLALALCMWSLARVTGWHTMVNIWAAVEREDLDAIQRYVDRGGNLDMGSSFWGTTPLFYALKLHKKESYRKLLDVGADPSTLCRGGNVVMHFAAYEKDSDWLRLALDAGGNPSLLNRRGYGWIDTVPLVFAISAGSLDNVKLLCERGADINAVDLNDRTPLAWACATAHFDIVYYLLEKGADYNVPTRLDHTFVWSLRNAKPELYHNFPNDTEKWCRDMHAWMIAHGADPGKATWDGTKWVFQQKNGNEGAVE